MQLQAYNQLCLVTHITQIVSQALEKQKYDIGGNLTKQKISLPIASNKN